jgi:photosystem II stability/assembly factor-like uncharacterized protein
MLTPTATPYEEKPTDTVPAPSTPGIFPGLEIPTLTAGQVITPTLVNFLDLLTGWGVMDVSESAVSGFVLRTEDGGSTWLAANPVVGFPPRSRFFALNAQEAWMAPNDVRPGEEVSAGYVWHTADGGKTWQSSQPIDLTVQDEPVVEYDFPVAIYFLDAQHGWLVVSVGHYMNQDVLEIFSTQDGGQTWLRQADKFSMGKNETAPMPCMVNGIAFVDPQHGFLAGNCFAVSQNNGWSILETRDGGHNWQTNPLPEPVGVPDVIRSGMKSGNVACDAMDVSLTPAGILEQHTCQLMDNSGNFKEYNFLFLSPDGGATWRSWSGQIASFVDSNKGFSLGSLNQAGVREFQSTNDGGQSWQTVSTVTWPMAQLDFVSATEGYVLASAWNSQTGAFDYALVHTINGGQSWEIVRGAIK